MKKPPVTYDQTPPEKRRKPPKPKPTPAQPRKPHRYPVPGPEGLLSTPEEIRASGCMVVT